MPFKKYVWTAILFAPLGCSPQPDAGPLFMDEGTAMTMPYKILIGKQPDKKNASEIRQIVASTFNEVNAIYNKWNPHSELSKFNEGNAQTQIPLSGKLRHLLLQAQKYVLLTGGKFDPTIEPVQRVWKKALASGRQPDEGDLKQAISVTGWRHIALGEKTAVKAYGGVQLDLGGIAKGYAVDLLVERLNAAGYPHVYVEWGGELRTSGRHPEGRPWKVYISRLGNPDPSQAVAFLEVTDAAVATSGDYLQQWTVGNQTYFHIINPASMAPLTSTHSSIASVTVMAPTCLEADVLATTAMLFPTVQEAEAWAEQQPEAKFWIYSRQKIQKTNDLH